MQNDQQGQPFRGGGERQADAAGFLSSAASILILRKSLLVVILCVAFLDDA
jgi:hypothetical protein